MKKEFGKRLITSGILTILLFLMLKFTIVFLSSLLIIFVISWLEFNALFEKIFIKKKFFLNIYLNFLYLFIFYFL